jgi:hypothetical protein
MRATQFKILSEDDVQLRFEVDPTSAVHAVLSNLRTVRILSSEMVHPLETEGFSADHPGRLLVDEECTRIPRNYMKPHVMYVAGAIEGLSRDRDSTLSPEDVALFPHWALPIEPDGLCVARAIYYSANPEYLFDGSFCMSSFLSMQDKEFDAKAQMTSFYTQLSKHLLTYVDGVEADVKRIREEKDSTKKVKKFVGWEMYRRLCTLLGWNFNHEPALSSLESSKTAELFDEGIANFRRFATRLENQSLLDMDAAFVVSVIHALHGQEVRYSSFGEFETILQDRGQEFDMPQGLACNAPFAISDPLADSSQTHYFPYESKYKFSYLLSYRDPTQLGFTAKPVGHASALFPVSESLFLACNHPLKTLYPATLFPVFYEPDCKFFFTPFHQFDSADGMNILHVRTGSIVRLQTDKEDSPPWFVLATVVKLSTGINLKALKVINSKHHEDSALGAQASKAWKAAVENWSLDPLRPSTPEPEAFVAEVPQVPVGLVSLVQLPAHLDIASIREFLRPGGVFDRDHKSTPTAVTRLTSTERIVEVLPPFDPKEHAAEFIKRQVYQPYSKDGPDGKGKGGVGITRVDVHQLTPFEISPLLDQVLLLQLVKAGLTVDDKEELKDIHKQDVAKVHGYWMGDLSRGGRNAFDTKALMELSKVFETVLPVAWRTRLADFVQHAFNNEHKPSSTGALSLRDAMGVGDGDDAMGVGDDAMGVGDGDGSVMKTKYGRPVRVAALASKEKLKQLAEAERERSDAQIAATEAEKAAATASKAAATASKAAAATASKASKSGIAIGPFFSELSDPIVEALTKSFTKAGSKKLADSFPRAPGDGVLESNYSARMKTWLHTLLPGVDPLPAITALNNVKSIVSNCYSEESPLYPFYLRYASSNESSTILKLRNVSTMAGHLLEEIQRYDPAFYLLVNLIHFESAAGKGKGCEHFVRIYFHSNWRSFAPFTLLPKPTLDIFESTKVGKAGKRKASDSGNIRSSSDQAVSTSSAKKQQLAASATKVLAASKKDSVVDYLNELNNKAALNNEEELEEVDCTGQVFDMRSGAKAAMVASTSKVSVTEKTNAEAKKAQAAAEKAVEAASKKALDTANTALAKANEETRKLKEKQDEMAAEMAELKKMMMESKNQQVSPTHVPVTHNSPSSQQQAAAAVLGPSNVYLPRTLRDDGASSHHMEVDEMAAPNPQQQRQQQQQQQQRMMPFVPQGMSPQANRHNGMAMSPQFAYQQGMMNFNQAMLDAQRDVLSVKKKKIAAQEEQLEQQQRQTSMVAQSFMPMNQDFSAYYSSQQQPSHQYRQQYY